MSLVDLDAPPRAPLRLREFETVEIPSDDVLRDGRLDVYPSIKDSGYLRVSIGTRGTTLQALGHVGVIPVNDRLTLEVIPRVPVTNLAHLLEISRKAPFALADALRLYDTSGELYPSLAGVYAAGLRQQVDLITDRGLFKEYERTEAITSFPHGRIDMGRTMQRSMARGEPHKAAISWFQRTADNPANRCLRYAVWRLARYVDQSVNSLSQRQLQHIRRDLNAAWQALDGVELDLGERFLEDRIVTGAQPLPTLRSYYRPALDLALAIIGKRAVVIEGGGELLRLPSMVVDMSDVFEAYLREVLIAASREEGWAEVVLDGNKEPPIGAASRIFPEPGEYVGTTPDIVLQRGAVGASTVPLLIEVKYKPAERLPKREDLNQTLTYAVTYGAPHVVIAQPKSDHAKARASGMHHLGTVAGIDVSYYVFDLSGDLAAEETAFASAIRSGST